MDNLAIWAEAGAIRIGEQALPPDCAPDQVLVRMLRAPINPADLLAIDGGYAFALDSGTPLGAEGIGVIERIGSAVTDLARGDRVLPLSRGNWCRHRLLNRTDLIALPATQAIALDQAAMLRINPPTARLLIEAAGAGAGEVMVQNGATSAVARWVRHLADRRGITVIDVVRRDAPALPGAIVDGLDLPAEIARAAGGRPVVAALDCVAGTATERLAECLAPGGRLVLYGHLSGQPISVRSQAMTGGILSITGFSLRPTEARLGPAGVRSGFADLFAAIADRGPEVPIAGVYPLRQVEKAVAHARSGAGGRVMLDLSA